MQKMKVFVTGASGFVGSAVVKELIAAGHQVLGLARSEAGANKIREAGADVYLGNIEDLDSLKRGAEKADGIIHTAFNHDDFSKFRQSTENDKKIIELFGDIFAGSDRPLVITSAIGILPRDRVVNELDKGAPGPNPRIASEEAIDTVAAKNVKVSAIRLPPTTHGEGDKGFMFMLANIAKQKGLAVYEGEGNNYWPAVHRFDAAKLYRLALEKTSAPGTRVHAVAEEGVSFRTIAETIGKEIGVPVASKSKEEAAEYFGWFAHFASMDIRASSTITQQTFNWHPMQPGLIEDLETNYFK